MHHGARLVPNVEPLLLLADGHWEELVFQLSFEVFIKDLWSLSLEAAVAEFDLNLIVVHRRQLVDKVSLIIRVVDPVSLDQILTPPLVAFSSVPQSRSTFDHKVLG